MSMLGFNVEAQNTSLVHIPPLEVHTWIGGTLAWDQTQSLAEKVLLSMCASRYQAGSLRGCVSAPNWLN